MTHPHAYRTSLEWTGAAQGPTTSYRAYSRAYVVRIDGKPDLAGTADPTFLGDASRHNPEDLLLAALSACHMLSYLALAARGGVHVVGYSDEAEATMVLGKGGGHFTEAILRPTVLVTPGADLELARELHHQAHQVCFIAASMNFPVRNDPTILTAVG